MGILYSLNIVNLFRLMSMSKVKINVKLPKLLCIVVVPEAQNGEFERGFGGFCVDCYYTSQEGDTCRFLITCNLRELLIQPYFCNRFSSIPVYTYSANVQMGILRCVGLE